MHPLRPLDIAVIFAYFVAVIVAGLVLAGRQRDASDYFLGHRGLPWWALMLSVVATETSALTVISIPGIAVRGNLTWLQITFGYLLGRIGVAYLLLPGYFDGSQDTAYQRLERRFGTAARRTASGVFLFTRCLADGVRMFATAITLAVITHWSLKAGILAIGAVTLLYTWVGGLRAVVWTDVIQLAVYLLGGIATIIVALHIAGGTAAFGRAWEAGKLRVFDFQPSFSVLYTFWGGLIGGALLSAATHGTEHLFVQRLLAARGLKDAQRALIGSGVFIIGQIGLFLVVGTTLWLAGADDPAVRSDSRLLCTDHGSDGSAPPSSRGPLAYTHLDGRAGRRRAGVPRPEHARRTARAERCLADVRIPARHLHSRRRLAARPAGRCYHGCGRQHRRHVPGRPWRRNSAFPRALAPRIGVAVVCAAGDGGHGARGHDFVARWTV